MTKFVGNSITFPKLSAAPSTPVSGDTYYDTTFNKPFTYNGTEWVDLGASGHTHTSFANNLQINKADSKVQLLNTTSGSGTEDGMYLLMADTNVGYLWNAETNGALVFGTGGAERARITPAGKLGIGTNAPAHQVEVVGPASVTVGLSAGGAGFAELELVGQAGKNYITSDDTLSFDIGGTERATVATTGLDVTSGTLSQGGTAVSLSGHSHSTSNITSGNFAATVSGGTGVTVTGGTGNASAPSIAIGQDVGTASDVTFNSVTTTGDLSANGIGVNFLWGTPSKTGPVFQLAGTNDRFWTGASSSGAADIGGSTSSGRAGILITKSCAGQPTTTVNGTGSTDAFADRLINGGIALDGSNNRAYFYSTGWKYAALTTPSDSRLKEEITEISGALDTLRQLMPVAFKWKNPEAHGRTDCVADDGKRLGFIADQVATTDLAHWVETLGVDDREAHLVDTTEVLAVNIPQNEMEALVVQALLDIDTRLKALENR